MQLLQTCVIMPAVRSNLTTCNQIIKSDNLITGCKLVQYGRIMITAVLSLNILKAEKIVFITKTTHLTKYGRQLGPYLIFFSKVFDEKSKKSDVKNIKEKLHF